MATASTEPRKNNLRRAKFKKPLLGRGFSNNFTSRRGSKNRTPGVKQLLRFRQATLASSSNSCVDQQRRFAVQQSRALRIHFGKSVLRLYKES
jgi:hypothetical protein